MDPFTLFVMLGFKITEEAMVQLGYTENTMLQPMDFKDFIPDVQTLEFIKQFEGYEPNAYLLKKENKYTIGVGSTMLYLPNGQKYRGNGLVLKSDTLNSLRLGMGLNSMTENEFAAYLMSSHIKYDASFRYYSHAVPALKNANVTYFRELVVALIDANYMSGSIFRSNSFTNFIIQVSKNPTDKKAISSAYFQMRYNYIRGLSSWSVNNHGWLIRLFCNAMLIRNGIYDQKKLKASFGGKNPSNIKNMVNKVREEFGLSITY